MIPSVDAVGDTRVGVSDFDYLLMKENTDMRSDNQMKPAVDTRDALDVVLDNLNDPEMDFQDRQALVAELKDYDPDFSVRRCPETGHVEVYCASEGATITLRGSNLEPLRAETVYLPSTCGSSVSEIVVDLIDNVREMRDFPEQFESIEAAYDRIFRDLFLLYQAR